MRLEAGPGDVTISRRTAKANSPMGVFSAVYTGTATAVEGLGPTDCGEILLGAPQAVYERSGFIRQSGLAVDQDAALERRVAALITSGEEDTSYSDAADRLRRQLNRRRANRSTGALPQLEMELSDLRQKLEELGGLEAQVSECEERRQVLLARQAELEEVLERHRQADLSAQSAQLQAAKNSLEQATETVDELTRATAALPSKEELESLRGALEALDTVDKAVSDAKAQRDAAQKHREDTEAILAVHPLSPHTPEEAEALPLDQGPRPKLSFWVPLLAVAVGAVAGGAAYYFTLRPLLAIGVGLILAGLMLLLHGLPLQKKVKAWESEQASLTKARQEQLSDYTIVYQAAADARQSEEATQAAYDALSASRDTNLSQLLSRVRAFQSKAENLSDAKRALAEVLALHTQLDRANIEARAARLRWELLSEKAEAAGEVIPDVPRPAQDRRQTESELAGVKRQLMELNRQLNIDQGRLSAYGDPDQLRADLSEKTDRHRQLTLEYEALTLASQVLDQANTALQNRFSPALGERAAAIFTKLTNGKYNRVLLDRQLNPSAQEAGALLPHEIGLLSQGAADQLYLAVRLAICELVLPRRTPIVLDDALVTFSDDRMASALDYLVEAAEDRQILLFTCQKREGDYLRQAHPGQFHDISL
jgi:hypothetical protein